MNTKTTTMIEEACDQITSQGIKITRDGSWFTWEEKKIVACDPIGACLIAHQVVPSALDPEQYETLVMPGLVKAACLLLKVDPGWLYRFWMGFDRGYQIKIINDKEKTEGIDEVSRYALSLSKKLS